jgi:hypothetical protein
VRWLFPTLSKALRHSPAAPKDAHELGSSCKRLTIASGLFCMIASAEWRRVRLGGVEAAPWCSMIASEE